MSLAANDTFQTTFTVSISKIYTNVKVTTSLRYWQHYEDVVSIASDAGAKNTDYATKWEQEPDLGQTGIDVDVTQDFPQTWSPQILADDFKCTIPTPITDIDLMKSISIALQSTLKRHLSRPGQLSSP